MASLPAGTLQAFDPQNLHLFHRNPRRGDIAAIKKSLDANGQYKPVIVNSGTITGRPFEVLAGNHTVLAARELELSEIQAYVIDVDDATATRINLVDNKTAQLGDFDDAILADLLTGFDGELFGTGYTSDDLDSFTALLGTPVGMPGIETPAAPAPAPEPVEPSEPAPGLRNIALGGLPPRYAPWLRDAFTAMREQFNVETNADVIVALVVAHTGTGPASE
jgi:hypothetical protein